MRFSIFFLLIFTSLSSFSQKDEVVGWEDVPYLSEVGYYGYTSPGEMYWKYKKVDSNK